MTTKSMREQAYQALVGDVRDGRLKPGDAIAEAAYAKTLGCSRTPVREAIQMLAREGLIEVLPQRGTLVSRVTPQEVRLSFELRAAVEGYAARLAAERATEEDIRRMREILSHESHDPYDQGLDFHRAVVASTRNLHLVEAFENSSLRVVLASRSAAEESVPSVRLHTHLRVLDEIEQRNPEAAESAMREHLAENSSRLIARLL